MTCRLMNGQMRSTANHPSSHVNRVGSSKPPPRKNIQQMGLRRVFPVLQDTGIDVLVLRLYKDLLRSTLRRRRGSLYLSISLSLSRFRNYSAEVSLIWICDSYMHSLIRSKICRFFIVLLGIGSIALI